MPRKLVNSPRKLPALKIYNAIYFPEDARPGNHHALIAVRGGRILETYNLWPGTNVTINTGNPKEIMPLYIGVAKYPANRVVYRDDLTMAQDCRALLCLRREAFDNAIERMKDPLFTSHKPEEDTQPVKLPGYFAEVIDLYSNGMDADAICMRLNMSKTQVYEILGRYDSKLPTSRPAYTLRERITRLHGEGYDIPSIASTAKVNETYVHWILGSRV